MAFAPPSSNTKAKNGAAIFSFYPLYTNSRKCRHTFVNWYKNSSPHAELLHEQKKFALGVDKDSVWYVS
jgi:hypothetical protein